MNLIQPNIGRRSFLKAAAPFALGLSAIARGQVLVERGRFSEDDIPLAREKLLSQVNEERARVRLSQLKLDELACQVAGEHARDMVQKDFLNHWGSDGHKPYHRYSFAGGTDALRENVSSARSIQSITPTAVGASLHDMHLKMLQEVPPNDGHRQTILFPQLTHVGFGIAMEGHNLRLDELYLAHYLEMDPIPRQAKRYSAVTLRGRILNLTHKINGIDLFYEPLPAPPEIEWLRQPRSYGLPNVHESYLPRLPEPLFYADGGNGNIDMKGIDVFQVRIGLSKKPGINTIVVWLRAGPNGTVFPATGICIRVE
ncbi:MAG TPA: CAP domain-containing protein [Pyrinomonadaceae bacterium]|nr:CAP domain-containing protein [Pyrinomonadaceae bacterium]